MSSKKPHILLLSVSAGAGHFRAAEALRAHAAAHFPQVEASHVDVMTLVPPAFRALYTDFYIRLVERHPALWAYLYRMTDRAPRDALFSQVRRAAERLNTRKLRETLRTHRPDHVICTHFLPAELLAHEIRRGRFQRPLWVQVTDFDLHRMWVQPHVHGYFAASAEVAFRMEESGITAGRAHVSGIPIMPAFSQPLDRGACARELGLDPARLTFLLMSGGAGLASAGAMLTRMLRIAEDFQVIALAGKNAALLASYETLARQHPQRVRPVGFTTTIERLMAASDVAITKPGGLTISECLAMRLPMVLIAPIPGQEERNADYLMEQGAALKAYDPAGLEFRVRQLLAEPQRLARMRERLEVIRRPDAAKSVLARVLDDRP
jgi:processive 1,2-diacylglycerol beta-glucosyltransferase